VNLSISSDPSDIINPSCIIDWSDDFNSWASCTQPILLECYNSYLHIPCEIGEWCEYPPTLTQNSTPSVSGGKLLLEQYQGINKEASGNICTTVQNYNCNDVDWEIEIELASSNWTTCDGIGVGHLDIVVMNITDDVWNISGTFIPRSHLRGLFSMDA
jgi:hypothetical protein